MPNTIRITSPYLPTGNPDTYNADTIYDPGALGSSFDLNDKTYEIVQLDSGATSATPTGVVAANQLAFWKSKTNRIVTNDRRLALNNSVANASGNEVAGVFRNAVTAGYYTCILAKGHSIPVKSGTITLGQTLTADTDANGPRVAGVAVGTAPGYLVVGVARAADSGGNVSADIDIPVLA